MTSLGRLSLLTVLLLPALGAGEKYSKEQLGARYYFDLGPATIDVSSYPEGQRRNYEEFSAHCSKCHTLARPINAPITTRKDWERFVLRMHRRTELKLGSKMSQQERRRIVDFLVYDSRQRKVMQRARFDEQTRELQKLFEAVQEERTRLQLEENRRKGKNLPMEIENQPAPRPN